MCFPSLSRYSDWSLLLLRLVIGAIFLYHGLTKWQMEDPNTVMMILKYAEPLAGAALVLGAAVQLASTGLVIIMLGAIYNKATGFGQASFDLFGTFSKWEFDLMILAGCVALITMGAGRISLEALMMKKCKTCKDCCGKDVGQSE